jgi:hypothetical protein
MLLIICLILCSGYRADDQPGISRHNVFCALQHGRQYTYVLRRVKPFCAAHNNFLTKKRAALPARWASRAAEENNSILTDCYEANAVNHHGG